MKKALTLTVVSILVSYACYSQVYFTKNGKIHFDATAASSPERIEGTTKTATSVLDTQTGQFQFSILMKSFVFERALMEEHFNENYVESDKFPKAEFKGSVQNNTAVNFTKDGSYTVRVKGKLTIHGVTRDVEVEGQLAVKAGKIQATASFPVLLSDYKVSIPGLVADKIAKQATIEIDCQLEPLKK
jgi:polyisoprenoid-binding protein YceI